MVIKEVALYLKNSKSDKVYNVIIEQGDPYPGGTYTNPITPHKTHTGLPSPAYRVVAHYGKRDALLQESKKCGWRDIAHANLYFDLTVEEKIKKGYKYA